MDLDELCAATRALAAALRIEDHLVPTNRATERERVLAAGGGDPAFTYAPLAPDAGDRTRSLLHAVDPDASPWHAVLADHLGTSARLADAVVARDPIGITEATVIRHGVPSTALVADAQAVLAATADTAPDDGPRVPAQAAAAVLQDRCAAAGLEGWRVEVHHGMSARMDVQDDARRIRVRAGSAFSDHELHRLAVHEVGTHAARGANGATQSAPMLRFLRAEDLATEEGLAAWHEQRHGLSDPHVLRTYALRVLAATWALEGSFADVFAGLCEHTDGDAAFEVVARAKRGFTDPSVPGAHVKDQVYLAGLRAVDAHLAAEPDDHDLLLSGYVGLPHLDLVRSLRAAGELVEPRVRPEATLIP